MSRVLHPGPSHSGAEAAKTLPRESRWEAAATPATAATAARLLADVAHLGPEISGVRAPGGFD